MFSQELYNDEARAIINISAREIPGIVTREEIEKIMTDHPELSINDFPYLEERKSLMGVTDNSIQTKSTSNMTGTIENAREQYFRNLPQQNAEIYALQQTAPNTAGTTAEEIKYPRYVGTGALSEMLHDRDRMQKGRVNSVVDLIKAESAQYALGRTIDSWKYRNAPRVSKQEAESYYKSLGLDLKEKEQGISEFEMLRKAETAIKKQELEYNMSLYNNTNDITFLNRVEILGTSLAAGMFSTPLDSAVTAASFILPELAVGTVSSIGKGLSEAYKTERVLNAMSRLRTAKNIASTVDTATTTTAAGNATRSIYMTTKSRLMDPKLIKAVETVENMKGLNYASLSAGTKTGLDALSWVGLDVPDVMVRAYDAQNTEIYQYTGKNALTELMLRGSLGVVVPGTLRYIGKKIGIRPFEMTIRQINELENKIKADVARGDILASEAKVQLAEVEKLKENLSVIQGSFKKPHPVIQEQIDGLERANVSSEIVTARIQKVIELMKAGIPVSVWDLPEFGSIFSHINARVLNGLIDGTRNAAEVFGKNLVFKKLDHGLIEATIIGETGLLGRIPLIGRSEEELIEQIGNMYRGFVLEDPNSETSKSLAIFMDWIKRDAAFANALEDILSDYTNALKTNKEQGGILNRKDLRTLNIKGRLEEAYIRYKLGDEKYLAYDDASYQDLFMEATGQETKSALTDEMIAAEKEAEEFSKKWLKEYKKGTGVYDFLSKEGMDDKGAYFSSYVDSLKKAYENNTALADSGNIVQNMEEARVKAWLDKMDNLQVSEDTDLNRLFGTSRMQYEELQDLVTDTNAWNDVATRKKIEVDNASASEERKQAVQMLDKYSTKEDSAGSAYRKASDIVKKVDSLKENNFTDIKSNFFNTLKNNSSFKKLSSHIEAYIGGGKQVTFIKESIKDALLSAFDGTRLGDFLPEDEINVIVNSAYKHLTRAMREDPKILEALYGFEKLLEKYPELKQTPIAVEEAKTAFKETVQEYKGTRSEKVKQLLKNREDETLQKELSELDKENVEKVRGKRELAEKSEKELAEKDRIISELQTKMNEFFEPVSQIIDSELTRLQVQKLNDIDIMQAKFSLMVQHPELAAEIITAGSTQTVYDFFGARRNLEYIRRSAGLYEKDVYYTLSKMDSKEGTNLAEYFANKDNRNEIEKALINIKHGTDTQMNSDASRVAQVILNEQSTLYSDFSNYGSIYARPMNLINRRQLKYADSVISDSEISKLEGMTDIESTTSMTNLIESMTVSDGIRYGDNVTPFEKGKSDIISTMQEVQNILDSFFAIENKSRKKVGLWALRSFDLDEMFDKKGRAALGYNVIRDAIFSGKIDELIDGDYLNLYYLKRDLTELRNTIIGRTPGITESGSWIDNFYNGFNDFGGVIDGRKSAYLDAFESTIVFKDANAELEAVNMFGYDSMQKMMVSNFDLALKAQYSLEIFGSDPLGIAHDLMNAFENARKSNTVFKDKLKALADKNGVDLSKYQIRKDQRESVDRFIKYACGMREQAPTDGIRVMQALRNLCSFSLLAKAGMKSASDWGTIGENLIANGLIDRGEALSTMVRARNFFKEHPELHYHLTASSILETEDLASFILNDPLITMSRLSDNVTWVDRLEDFSHTMSTGFLNNFSHIADWTNSNRKVAARTMQHAIGMHKDKTFDELNKMSYMLENDGINEITWDIMRKYMVQDLNKGYDGPAYWYFDPFLAHEIPDQVIEEAMKREGRTNLSQTAINKYRRTLLNKCFTLINSSADEFVSVPSERVMTQLRFNNMKGSWAAFWAETVTQYQAFPCAMAYNTYGKEIAHAVKGQTGITAIDMFNPFNKVAWAAKSELYNNIFKSAFSIGMTMLLVDSIVDAAAGKMEAPVTSDGKPNIDLILRRATAPMGPLGLVVDTLYNAIDASGQRGGGISVQMAPAASNVVRTLYRNKKILTSDRIPDKGSALGAEFANEAGRVTGLKTLPFVAPVYQMIIGSYLDMMEQGGEANWSRTLNLREKRGAVIMPWEENPQPFNPALFEGL